jgi:hypothetical protein
MSPVKATTCTDGLILAAGETWLLSAIRRLASDGEEEAAVVSAHHRQCLQGNPGPGGWADRLTRDDRPSHGLQGAGSEVNTTTTRLERMAVIERVKSSSAGREVKIVADSIDTITVAAHRHPTLKPRDLVGPRAPSSPRGAPPYQRLRPPQGRGARPRRPAGLGYAKPDGMSTGAAVRGSAPVPGPTLKSSLVRRIQGDRRQVNALARNAGPWLAPLIQRHDRPACRALAMPRDRHPWRDPAACLATACPTNEVHHEVPRG